MQETERVIALALVLCGMTAVVAAGAACCRCCVRARVARPRGAATTARSIATSLTELERDVARGLIGEAEAQSARLEIERRLLAAAAPAGGHRAGATAGAAAGATPAQNLAQP